MPDAPISAQWGRRPGRGDGDSPRGNVWPLARVADEMGVVAGRPFRTIRAASFRRPDRRRPNGLGLPWERDMSRSAHGGMTLRARRARAP